MVDKKVNIIIGAVNAVKEAARGSIGQLRKLGNAARAVMRGVGRVTRRASQAIKRFGIGAIAAIGGAVKHASAFRNEMAKVSTLTRDADVSQFTKQIIELSTEIGLAKDVLAKGLYQTLSAGVPEDNAIEFLTTAAKAAVGGVSDLTTAVDAMTTVIDATNFEFKDLATVSDIMFSTVKKGKVDFDQLSTRMGFLVGIAAEAGVKFEELMGIFAVGTKVVRPEQLFVGLRAALLAITAPGEELTRVFKDLGTTGEQLVREKGLAAAFNVVTEAAGGSQAVLKKLIPTLEALPTILAVTGKNADKVRQSIADMENVAGASAEAFERMDMVRGWPRLWQSILAPITRIGIRLDKWAQNNIPAITKLIKQWTGSPEFAAFLEKMETVLGNIKTTIEDILAGGTQREQAFKRISAIGEKLAGSAIDMLLKFAPQVGAAMARGFLEAPKFFGRATGRQKAAEASAAGRVRPIATGESFGAGILAELFGGPAARKRAEAASLQAQSVITNTARLAEELRLLREIRDGVDGVKKAEEDLKQ